MSDTEDFAALFAREAARPVLEMGQIVKGRVIHITAESVFRRRRGKGEAWIERAELTDQDGRLKVAVGDEVEATVVSTGTRCGFLTSLGKARRRASAGRGRADRHSGRGQGGRGDQGRLRG